MRKIINLIKKEIKYKTMQTILILKKMKIVIIIINCFQKVQILMI